MTPTKFWTRVVRGDGCWAWKGAHDRRGYGVAWVSPGQRRMAHRVAYELTSGPVPAGLELDHLCRNPGCVRPDHLEPVTHWENLMRSPITLAAKHAAVTHCPQGHSYDEHGVRESDGKRRCKVCRRERRKARRLAANDLPPAA